MEILYNLTQKQMSLLLKTFVQQFLDKVPPITEAQEEYLREILNDGPIDKDIEVSIIDEFGDYMF